MLEASDGAVDNVFGASVAISGDTIVVGAPWNSSGGSGGPEFIGAAYVFTKPGSGWASTSTFNAKLIASDPQEGDFLGFSVAISGNTIVAGAPYKDSGRGAVYVFEKPVGGWGSGSVMFQTAKLTASDGAQSDHLGSAVAVEGDTVVAGAPDDDSTVGDSGSAYVFTKPASGWSGSLTQTVKLTASDVTAFDTFGSAVAASGGMAVVGAPGQERGSDLVVGAVYVFLKPGGGWASTSTFDAKLTVGEGAEGDQFGSSVAVEGDTVVVRARTRDVGSASDAGAAYVFFKPSSGWATTSTFDAKLTAADAAASDRLGRSASVFGSLVVVGAPGVDVGSHSSQGAAYIFTVGGECGNGIVEHPAEECDDGNTRDDGNCCSATCTFTAGAACDDGLFCTANDVCDAETRSCLGQGDPCAGEECQVCDEGADQCVPVTVGTNCTDDGNQLHRRRQHLHRRRVRPHWKLQPPAEQCTL
ncbi:MAG: hypothetical protein N3C12_07190 [Candidatus Binatia bacterium]|nr:hypothetical protein [Candidatus Binatia bacterium]